MTVDQYDVSSCVAVDNGVEKPATDTRVYKHITLPNRLRVMIVSDPEAEKAAAAMSVNVGQLSDPEDIPGLAHFCEHMLFLGTSKYPDENEYSQFLSSHGGMSNAYTALEDTNYFFDVGADHLEGALDRFAQFFLCPLFTESATERELQAVDSEHSKNRLNDMWRLLQLSRSTSDPGHPFSKFGTGSAATLWDDAKAKGLDTRKALLDFHHRHYSANRMCLSVLGRESVEQLQEWVTSLFSGVEDRDVPEPIAPPKPFLPEQLGRRLRVVPVKDLHNIIVLFPTPPPRQHYRSSPLRYLSHLIGHESPGSILAYLRGRNWANELSAGPSHSASGFAFFEVSIEATEEGMAHAHDVVEVVFQYVAMLRQHGPLKWVHDEVAAEAAAAFRFRSKSEPCSYASHVASSMREYPAEHSISGPYLIREWDPEAVASFLTELVPANARVMLVDKQFEERCGLEETWYRTRYDDEALGEEELVRLRDSAPCEGLSLPQPNEFIATDFALRAEMVPVVRCEDGFFPFPAPPKLVADEDKLRLWHKLDTTFGQPKTNLIAVVHLDDCYTSARAAVLTDLFVQLATEGCNEIAYFAEVAGLNFRLQKSVSGMIFRVRGFNQKMSVLVDKVAAAIADLEVDEAAFQRLHQRLADGFKSFAVSQPYMHAFRDTTRALRQPFWSEEEKERALGNITVADMKAFAARLFARVHIEAFVHGNTSEAEALELGRVLEGRLGARAVAIPRSELVQMRALELPPASFLRPVEQRNPEQDNHAMQMVLRCGMWQPKRAALVELVAHILTEPYFDQLRTKETLGYIVWSGVSNVANALGLQFIIQSDKADPEYLDSRTELFLEEYGKQLAEMGPEQFELNRKAVLVALLQAPKSLAEESNLHWPEIEGMTYLFDRPRATAEALRSLTIEDAREFFNAYVHPASTQRRKYCAHVSAPQRKESSVSKKISEQDPASGAVRPALGGLDEPASAVGDLLSRDEYGRYVVDSAATLHALLPLHPPLHAGVPAHAVPRL